jgi:hypothetical protein
MTVRSYIGSTVMIFSLGSVAFRLRAAGVPEEVEVAGAFAGVGVAIAPFCRPSPKMDAAIFLIVIFVVDGGMMATLFFGVSFVFPCSPLAKA